MLKHCFVLASFTYFLVISLEEKKTQSILEQTFDKSFIYVIIGFCSMTFVIKSFSLLLTFFALEQQTCDAPQLPGLPRDVTAIAFVSTCFNAFGCLGSLIVTFILIKTRRETSLGLGSMLLTAAGLLTTPWITGATGFIIGTFKLVTLEYRKFIVEE